MNDWIQEIGNGAAAAGMNPVFYAAIIAVVVAGFMRVKRERKEIRVGMQSWALELNSFLGWGLLLGVLFSAIIVTVGVEIPLIWIYMVSLLMLIGILTWQFRALSPAFVIPLAAGIIYGLSYLDLTLPAWVPEIAQDPGVIGVTSIVMGILLFAEGILMKVNAPKRTSPRIIRTPRGLNAGAFFTKRLWLVPLFLLVPAGSIEPIGWWPVITFGSTSWSLVALPFVIGFQLTVVHDLPAPVIRQASQEVIWLSALVTIVAVAGYWAPYLFIAAFVLAFAGRVFLALKTRSICRHSGYHFMNRENGVMVVDIIPGTPADKMGITRGEVIKKLNGQPVKNEYELYAALQKNRVHCKLEVLNHQGEMRYVQRALHEGQHHQLGIITVEDREREFAPDSA